MAVKITVDMGGMEKMVKAIGTPKVSKKAAGILIKNMKEFIRKGVSPVKGFRRFPAYLDPAKYPKERKPVRPVNMKLNGDMLKALRFKVVGNSFTVGWYGGSGSKGLQKKKANNHNTGDTVPERRLLPTKKDEQYNVSITRALRDFYARTISAMLKRSE